MKRRLFTDQYIVITGAAGLLGSSVVRTLNQMGYQNLVLVDSLEHPPKWRHLLGTHFQEFLLPYQLLRWLEPRHQQIEAILHLGSNHELGGNSPDSLIDNNYRYSVALAEFALKHQVRFVYTSCQQTYGDGSRGFSTHLEVLEKLEPLSITGFSHHLFDLWCLHQNIFDEVVCCKIFDLLGFRDQHKPREMQVIRRMAEELLETGRMTLYASPQPDVVANEALARDFIWVEDAAKMVCSFLKNDISGIFNIGRGHAVTWHHLAEMVAHALELPLQTVLAPMPATLSQRSQMITCADLASWRQHGHPPAPTPLQDAIRSILAAAYPERFPVR